MTVGAVDRAIDSLKAAGLEAVLHTPDQESYEARVESYWSQTPRLRPWAFVQPRNTAEVSQAVKAVQLG